MATGMPISLVSILLRISGVYLEISQYLEITTVIKKWSLLFTDLQPVPGGSINPEYTQPNISGGCQMIFLFPVITTVMEKPIWQFGGHQTVYGMFTAQTCT